MLNRVLERPVDWLANRYIDVLEWYLERDQKNRKKHPFKLGD